MSKFIAIIGSGPAGLTAGYLLQKKGYQVHIYESYKSIGGMCKSFNLFDGIVDCGPHRFFSSDRRVNEFWLDIIDGEYEMVKRKTRIYYNNRFFDYPIKPINAIINLGLVEGVKCIFSYILIKIFPIKNKNSSFESWTYSRFGKRLYEIFFKSYSEKLWGIPCNELSADFASQRIKKLSLFEALKGTIIKNKKHATLIDEFAFPNYGTGFFYEKLAIKFKNLGGKIFYNTKIVDIKINKKIKLNNLDQNAYRYLISTMPITNLVNLLCKDEKILSEVNKLKFRNTLLIYVHFEKKNLFSDQWIYINSSDVRTGRITNFENWNNNIKSKTGSIICFEYWFNDDDKLWSQGEKKDFFQLVKNDIEKISLFQNVKFQQIEILKVPKCYPVYKIGYKKNLKCVQDFLDKQKNVIAIGRYGSFKYNNQDHSILMGIIASNKILYNKNENLWEINTDYDYQEKSYITSTGLKNIK